ncbi:MAG: hypothetical protein MI923_28570 [Phycisphaerales bacterium]|nr:hypothetical protein [Phycisphaerales bacterium]
MVQQTAERTKKDGESMFNEATNTFNSAMEAGLNFQREAVKSMGDMFTCCGTMENTRGRVEAMATDSIDMVRKNAEQTQKFFDEGCRNGINMLRKTFEANKVEDKDVFAQTRDLWQSAFDAMRGNVEAAARTTTQTIENMSGFMTKCTQTNNKKSNK